MFKLRAYAPFPLFFFGFSKTKSESINKLIYSIMLINYGTKSEITQAVSIMYRHSWFIYDPCIDMRPSISLFIHVLHNSLHDDPWNSQKRGLISRKKRIFSVKPPPPHSRSSKFNSPPHRSELVSEWLKFTRAWVKTLHRLLFRISFMVWGELNQWGE